jgi:hypothetical protein
MAAAAAQSNGRPDDALEQCIGRDLELITVGQCLSLEREKSTDELAAACRLIQDLGLFGTDPDEDGPLEPFTTMGECIAYLRANA